MPDVNHSPNSYESQQIKKDKTILISDYYKSPQSSPLIFHFEPIDFKYQNRIKKCSINHASIENKDLYIIDNFFEKQEMDELRTFFANATYSRSSYGSTASIEKGEKPAYSMNTKERWNLFSSPPHSIQELHKLLSFFAYHLDAEITTQPWELCRQSAGPPSVIPSVIVNYHTEGVSRESMQHGRHQDYNTEKGIFYGIPILYKTNTEYHESHFVNGAPGKPWLVSLMLYSFSEEFKPEYLMGTAFYNTEGEVVLKANCQDARLVLFDGDIFHSPEESNIPSGINPWRVSYVLKLIVNPKNENQHIRMIFSKLLHKWSTHVHELTLGINTRI